MRHRPFLTLRSAFTIPLILLVLGLSVAMCHVVCSHISGDGYVLDDAIGQPYFTDFFKYAASIARVVSYLFRRFNPNRSLGRLLYSFSLFKVSLCHISIY